MTAGIPDFGKARLLVAGDVMLDRYWTGPTQRISPEAPVPVVRIQKDETRPGGAANVALNAAALGVKTRLLGVVGKDETARLLREQLAAHRVAAAFQESQDRPTITKLRVLSRNQQLIRLDFEESLSVVGAFNRKALVQQFRTALEDAQVAVLSDYGKGTLTDAPELIQAARAQKKAVLVDPKGHDWSIYRNATLITPNTSEFEAVVGKCRDEAHIVEKGENLRRELGLEALLVTRSEHGMTLIQPGHGPLHLPTEAREVFDVTGAGDTVIATLGAALAAGHDLAHSARLANLAAGIVVGKLGTATVSVPELVRASRRGHEEDAGVLPEAELLERTREARAHGETVVFTNGVFDLLHTGHVRYLEAAKKLGDVLVVAVNDDDSVRRLKGPTRPVNAVADRMRVLAALRCVDWVVKFSEDTPARLIGRVLPDVLVKGGDYKPEQIAGHEAVRRNGGQVVVLDFHAGYSTTSLLERSKPGPRPARPAGKGKRARPKSG
ncbi:MAG TPA: bifunctional D-glycero-beta-D-manno-heptose-7-phosphate kinase/D-glycero-beta-D-manno-heptose 1-phosphate adenylyltransferase HldE [Candidatus Binatia bacterium]|nr:bifunctional D-glycero-beta-D-manno-heptose-7-phosphate kinase/D-glycero-beta-D-manno-heptose 1-phosphate adenylyltransferase HldE [Candidatus Binatia bacterium]